MRDTDQVQLVIDANVVVQLCLSGADLGPLLGHDLIAPPIMPSEVMSSLSEMVHRGELAPVPARLAAVRMPSLPIRVQEPPDLFLRAWDLARSLGWAKTYDAEYVALSMMTGSPLITIDDRLRRGAGHIVDMPLISEIHSPG